MYWKSQLQGWSKIVGTSPRYWRSKLWQLMYRDSLIDCKWSRDKLLNWLRHVLACLWRIYWIMPRRVAWYKMEMTRLSCLEMAQTTGQMTIWRRFDNLFSKKNSTQYQFRDMSHTQNIVAMRDLFYLCVVNTLRYVSNLVHRLGWLLLTSFSSSPWMEKLTWVIW